MYPLTRLEFWTCVFQVFPGVCSAFLIVTQHNEIIEEALCVTLGKMAAKCVLTRGFLI